MSEKPNDEQAAKSEPIAEKPAAGSSAARKPAAKVTHEGKPAAADKPARATRQRAAAKAEKADAQPTPAAAPEKRGASGAQKPAADKAQQPAAASARRSARPETPAPRRKVVHAKARYVRTSARKARMVCVHLRGKSVSEARAILAFTPREVARDWSKLLESDVANAENNHELLQDDLLVQEAYADEGPTIKRFRPRAMGRATPIRKRTSHLTITLTPRP